TFVNSQGIRVISQSLKGQSFSYRSSRGRWYEKIEIPLLGTHQIYNAAAALEVLEVMKNYYCIREFQTEEGFRNTRWRGRVELLSEHPLIFCDGAHNPDGARCLAEFLRNNFTNRRIIYIMGVLADKDYRVMLRETAGIAECIYTVAPDSPRALPGSELGEAAEPY